MIAVVAVTLLSLSATITSSNAATKSPITIRVDLNVTTIRAGHSIHGTAFLTNSSSKSIPIQTWECSPWLFVGLANKDISYDPAVATVACSRTDILKPGKNRISITVMTVYQECAGGGPATKGGPPLCTKKGMPSLPKGSYHISVITNGMPTGTSYTSSIRVTLT